MIQPIQPRTQLVKGTPAEIQALTSGIALMRDLRSKAAAAHVPDEAASEIARLLAQGEEALTRATAGVPTPVPLTEAEQAYNRALRDNADLIENFTRALRRWGTA